MSGRSGRLSVIVPSLNEADVIRPLLQALQPLRGSGHELILADGGSTDDTVSIAEPMVDHLVITQPGRAIQMNAGARMAVGDIFWFLHADSRFTAELPEQLISYKEIY